VRRPPQLWLTIAQTSVGLSSQARSTNNGIRHELQGSQVVQPEQQRSSPSGQRDRACMQVQRGLPDELPTAPNHAAEAQQLPSLCSQRFWRPLLWALSTAQRHHQLHQVSSLDGGQTRPTNVRMHRKTWPTGRAMQPLIPENLQRALRNAASL
jgi:hypothetical protein